MIEKDGVTDLVIWGLVECWLVLILGSLPPLRSLFLRLSEQVTASSRSRRPTHGYQRSKTDKVIPMYPRGKRANGEEVSHESEENIVTNETDIVKTTDIHISRGGGKRWGGSDKDSTRMETVEV